MGALSNRCQSASVAARERGPMAVLTHRLHVHVHPIGTASIHAPMGTAHHDGQLSVSMSAREAKPIRMCFGGGGRGVPFVCDCLTECAAA